MTIKDLLSKRVGFVSLGCDKNRVDLEVMIGQVKQAGFVITNDINEADVVIINTCAFIKPARVESVDTILSVGTLHKK